ncbi:P1 family peptidase [Rubrivirga sp.]|uniref:DmpA family aminopeptidase n=1 Tax=Rubrivirga sp. TaxID=1885344 RepID=UPI003B519265
MRLFPLLAALLVALAPSASGQDVRARDLGIPFDGIPGPLNAITDVPGVEVGHTTLIRGDGPLVKGEGPVRTGVTAILPRGRTFDPVMAATYALNGNGEMTGVHWIEESGYLETPIAITNTFSVGVVRDAVVAWMDSTGINADPAGGLWYTYPLVAETYDVLNDILGQHVTRRHAFDALDAAAPGPVAEGNVGGGTGMIAHGFKGGIGTASRLTGSGHTLGVLVQANYGGRDRFHVAGVPVGQEITDLRPNWDAIARGSIIVVVATDAPLLPPQLQRLAERVPLAIGRMGGVGSNGSGDIFVAFSTGNPGAWAERPTASLAALPNDEMNDLFEATVGATEEAILNAMVAAETMTGRDGLTAHALPHDRLQEVLRRYGRWVEPSSLPRAVAVETDAMRPLVGHYRGEGPIAEARVALDGDRLSLEIGASRRRIVRLADGRWRVLGTDLDLDPTPGGVRLLDADEVVDTLERVGR